MRRGRIFLSVALNICFALLLIFSNKNITLAANTANVSISSASATVGENVTVSVTVSSGAEIYATQMYLSYDSNILEYVSGSADTNGAGTLGFVNTDTFTSKTFTFTFKINGVGTSRISVVGNTRIIDGNEKDMTVSSNAGSVTGIAQANYSSDNSLSSLKISPGVLSPSFSPDVTYYTTSVDEDVDELIVNAVANDSNASVSVKYPNLDPGYNQTFVVVTAQNGTTRTYTIETTKGSAMATEEQTVTVESEPVSDDVEEKEIVLNGYRFKIANDEEKHPFPEGFVEVNYTEYEGVTVRAGKSESTGLVIMYLENLDGLGKSGFYIYNSSNGNFYSYNEVKQPELKYTILPLDESNMEIEGLTRTSANIAGFDCEVYTDKDRTFFVFYGVSSTGEKGFYRYLISEGTVQKFISDAVVASDTDVIGYSKNETKTAYRWYFYLACLVCAIILLAAITIITIQSIRLNKLGAGEEDIQLEDIQLDDDDDLPLDDK